MAIESKYFKEPYFSPYKLRSTDSTVHKRRLTPSLKLLEAVETGESIKGIPFAGRDISLVSTGDRVSSSPYKRKRPKDSESTAASATRERGRPRADYSTFADSVTFLKVDRVARKIKSTSCGDLTGIKKLDDILFLNDVVIDPEDAPLYHEIWEKNAAPILGIQSSKKSLKASHKKIDHFFDTKTGATFDLDGKLQIRPIPKKGLGILAKGSATTTIFPEGTIIGEYAGVLKYAPKGSDKEKDLIHNGYLFSIDHKVFAGWVIDAKDKGNILRFINHSSDPNIGVYLYFSPDGPHIIYYALRNIVGGEELTFDYGKGYWEALGIKPY